MLLIITLLRTVEIMRTMNANNPICPLKLARMAICRFFLACAAAAYEGHKAQANVGMEFQVSLLRDLNRVWCTSYCTLAGL